MPTGAADGHVFQEGGRINPFPIWRRKISNAPPLRFGSWSSVGLKPIAWRKLSDLSGASPYQKRRLLRLQEVQQQLLANGSHDRFGVKLNTLNRVAPVAQAHDLSLGGFGGDF
jgi:hypothetical protein